MPDLADFDAATCYVPDSISDTSEIPMAMAAQGLTALPLPSSLLTAETLELTFDFLFNAISSGIGPGGEFWALKPLEKEQLAKAWLPIIGPLLDSMGASKYAQLMLAAGMTMATVGPRLLREKNRRASATATTETAKSGDTPSSPVPQGLESLMRPTAS